MEKKKGLITITIDTKDVDQDTQIQLNHFRFRR